MGDAKQLIVKPISAHDANRIVRQLHYSGKCAVNPHVNLGVFMGGRCGGAMQFGPSMQKSSMLGLVTGTLWNEFIELNRMAFADWLPRNGESRCIGYAMRFIRKQYPWIKWVVSFADGTQCGDGTIYRASGFVLTGCNQNTTIHEMPDGFRFADIGLRASSALVRKRVGYNLGEKFSSFKARTGCKRVPGFQLRYIYFLDPTARERLTVPILPFSEIEKRGAAMYRGKPVSRASSADSGTSGNQPERGGANPTDALHHSRAGSIATDAPAIQTGEGGSTPTPALHHEAEGMANAPQA